MTGALSSSTSDDDEDAVWDEGDAIGIDELDADINDDGELTEETRARHHDSTIDGGARVSAGSERREGQTAKSDSDDNF